MSRGLFTIRGPKPVLKCQHCRYSAPQMSRIVFLVTGILLASLLGMSSIVHAGGERARADGVILGAFVASIASSESGATRGEVPFRDQIGFAHHHGECHGDHVNAQCAASVSQIAIDQGPAISRHPRFGAGVTTAPALRPPNV